jgi:ArsR family transcriptional regulator
MIMELSKLSRVFKALSNEQRLSLFRKIHEWESNNEMPVDSDRCCSGIERAFTKACGCMEISRSTVSHHLKELQNAGLITCTRSGQCMSAKINEETVEAIKNFLE